MPIIDNDFTEAELTAAIAAKPELLDNVVKKVLTTKEYNVLSKDEKTRYDSDFEQQLSIKRTQKLAPIVEKYVKETTGIEKLDANEKYYKYQERALKELAQKAKDLETEAAGYRGKSDMSKVERDNYEALKLETKANTVKIKELTDNHAKALSKASIENEVVRQTNTVTPKLMKSTIAGVSKAQEIVSKSTIDEINNMAQKDSRGQIILMDGENPVLNTDKTFKTVAQYYEEKMSEAGFVDDGAKTQGAGGTGGRDTALANIPGGAKNQGELLEWLRTNTMKGKSQTELLKEFDRLNGGNLPR